MRKPKILIIPDFQGGAHDLRATDTINHLSDKYEFTKKYWPDCKKPEQIDRDAYDLFFFIGYGLCLGQTPKNKTVCGITNSDFKAARERLPFVKAAHYPSERMYQFIKGITPLFYASHAKDVNIFKPFNVKNNRSFTVGMAVNGGNKQKGVKEVKEVVESIHGCQFISAMDKSIVYVNMPEFYNSIDVYVNFSQTEGCNNPIIESCCCGTPFISTDISPARELCEGGIIIDRNKENLETAIKLLKKDKDLKEYLGTKAREKAVERYSWEVQRGNYIKFLDWSINN